MATKTKMKGKGGKLPYPKPTQKSVAKKALANMKVDEKALGKTLTKMKAKTNKSRLLEAVAKLAKEFTETQAASESGLTTKQISGYLGDLVKAGDLKRTSPGSFVKH